MEISYLDAKTFGIGQLITQRKLFKVPEHQRNFSWDTTNIEQLFEDITNALDESSPDYFIGLIVLLGPKDNSWQILDGQQRIATITMIYSAIRYWLSNRENHLKDAEQIESEFIGVRQLGGAFSPRLTLNVENQKVFLESVIQKCADEDLQKKQDLLPDKSSNSLLVEGARYCRELVKKYVNKPSSSINNQATRLFNLSSYIEERVKIVVLDVFSESNAFIIFESLNARGNELSVLDLVKNHIFGNVVKGNKPLDSVRQEWFDMLERIEDKNADDFLKVFWTSQFGRVQKPQLYNKIKNMFDGDEGAIRLSNELLNTSDGYIALDDPQHDIWVNYGPLCQENIDILIKLGNRQVRAPIMSAIGLFTKELMGSLLWILIVLTVRYQIVGKRRTGALEILCARMANDISQKKIKTIKQLWDIVNAIIPSDEEFLSDFMRFSEKKAARAFYFLTQIELTFRKESKIEIKNDQEITLSTKGTLVDYVLPKSLSHDWEEVSKKDPDLLHERLFRIGNRCLLEESLRISPSENTSFNTVVSSYKNSKFILTNMIADNKKWTRKEIDERQKFLSEIAIKTWPLYQRSN